MTSKIRDDAKNFFIIFINAMFTTFMRVRFTTFSV